MAKGHVRTHVLEAGHRCPLSDARFFLDPLRVLLVELVRRAGFVRGHTDDFDGVRTQRNADSFQHLVLSRHVEGSESRWPIR